MKSEGEWVLSNRFFERVIRFEPQAGLYTHAWRHKLTGTDFLERARNAHKCRGEYSFAANGQWMTVMISRKLPKMIGTKIPTLDKVVPWNEDGPVNPTRSRGAAAGARSGDTIHDQRDVSQGDIDQRNRAPDRA